MSWTSDVPTLVHDMLAFQVEDLPWTALSIISMSLVFVFSISAAGESQLPPSRAIRTHNYLAISMQRKAAILAAIQMEQRRKTIEEDWATKGFRLKRLPPELQCLVLAYSAESPATYRSLVLVSRHIYHSTLRACLPLMPITLSSTKQLSSFSLLVNRRNPHHAFLPPEVGNLVHRLWISPLRREDFKHTFHILRACTNVRALACDARGLAMITSLPSFRHMMCRDLTLLLSRPQWDSTLTTPNGLQFLQQLTHLRVMGEQSVPNTVYFNHLLHLSYSERSNPSIYIPDDSEMERPLEQPHALSDKSTFPRLQQVVVTRRCGTEGSPALLYSPALVLLPVRRDWTEMDIWRNSSHGHSIWQQASKAVPAPKKQGAR